MRKYLLSTSALAGAALLSSAAVADVSISGSFEFDYAARDSNVSTNDGNLMGHDQEVHINFTNKTDSGLTITANNQLKMSGTGTSDDVSVSVSGGFGKLTMGKTDGANDAYGMNAMGLVQEEESGHLYNSTAGTTATIQTSTGGQGGNNVQASYHLPAMGGLTAGVSVGTGAVAANDEWSAFGLKYAMTTGDAAVTLGYSTKTIETTTAADNDNTSMGVNIAMGALSFTASASTKTGVDEDINTQSAGVSYDLGNGLVVAAASVQSEDDDDAGEEYNMTTYEAAYTIASGLSAVLNVSDFDYENGTDVDAAAHVDVNGTTTSLTIKASF
jgi:hypothetical protein